MTAYLIHGVGVTTLIEADDPDHAFDLLIERGFPDRGAFGRVVPPARDELVIRPLRSSDRGWLEDAIEHTLPPAFLRALAELPEAEEDTA